MFNAFKYNFNILKKRSGFTLFETIISVAIITMCSVTILQIFVFSGNLNSKANDIDNATSILTNVIEISKSADSPKNYFQNDFFSNSIVDNSAENGFFCYQAYDKDWQKISLTGDIFDITKLPATAKYVAKFNITAADSFDSNDMVVSFVQNDVSLTKYTTLGGKKYLLDVAVYYLETTDNINGLGSQIASLSNFEYLSKN